MNKRDEPTLEFHVSRKARDIYDFDDTLFSIRGDVVFANFHASRQFAQKINDKRDLLNYPERAVRAGHINAMGLLDEIFHFITDLYVKQSPGTMDLAMEWIENKVGKQKLDQTLLTFLDEFPPTVIYKGEKDTESYLNDETNGISNRRIALEEMIMLWLSNMNPAYSPFLELFDDSRLEKETHYPDIIVSLKEFFETLPAFGPDDEYLIDMLRSPAIAVPHSLFGQLDYIRQKWGSMLGRYLYRLLGSLDFLTEEEKMGFMGPGPAKVYQFGGLEEEPEQFSKDLDWMPKVVMLAKNAYVWLDQLSEKYQQSISRLDQIPEKELEELARWGFTSLWLIGLWERSKASKKIKQLCGNPEAEASAYSLYDYVIADDLGGEDAFQALKSRAWRYGIRMAGDMVPNHVGIDGKWVNEHPDWFISLDYSPFPSYTFNGPNLSRDDRVGIYVEDHYYDRSDAAVVFKRRDNWTGDEKFIYHGNDGTSMPWNDTAQINFLNPEAREAVIQTILHVAHRFPVIRFDAAMTLAKKHIQRLWFPEPGTGGAIASRAEHGMSKEEFDKHIPKEFWRQVVDRVAQEAPDTLLLAEAFWLLEGYFVRTLGMHRVYNSAFMNMLKNEDNAKYRMVIKNTIEFNPEILKRFVNFMNNPDEETAVAQFGKDDKYFGVCTLLATMPGLPMFGHGQIEGFTEKYGMEFRRAYWDEKPDLNLIQRHRNQIFPLLRKRYLFAEVENFLLYDFFVHGGNVNEDVFAYSNRLGQERALVVFHNKFAETRGWIRSSVGFSVRTGNNERKIVQRSLAEGLDIPYDENYFCIFRDEMTNLEYIRNCKNIHQEGLYFELHAFQYHVFLDFQVLHDDEWHHYRQLTDYLGGRGVPSIQEALKEIFLQPVHVPMKEIVNQKMFTELMSLKKEKDESKFKSSMNLLETKLLNLADEIKKQSDGTADPEIISKEIRTKLEIIFKLPKNLEKIENNKLKESITLLKQHLDDKEFSWKLLYDWTLIHNLAKIVDPESFEEKSRSWIDEWLFGKIIADEMRNMGFDDSRIAVANALLKILTSHQSWFKKDDSQYKPYQILRSLLKDTQIQQFVGVNRYKDELFFHKESFENLLNWLFIISVIDACYCFEKNLAEKITERYKLIKILLEAQKESEYKLENLLDSTKVQTVK